MSLPKRKAVELDSDDEELAFGKQILPVANLPETFDGEPMDGMQYLFTVRREFYRLPHISSVPNPYTTPPSSSSLKSTQIRFNDEPRPSLLPTEEWRVTFEKRFVNLRQNLTQPTITVNGSQEMNQQKRLPEKKERDRWWAFLIGKPELDWNPPKRPKVEKGRRQQRGRDRDDPQLLGPWIPVQDPQSNANNVAPFAVQEATAIVAPIRNSENDSPSGVNETDLLKPELLEGALLDGPHQIVYVATSKFQQPPEPTPSLLRGINHSYAVHLLMYFSYWISLHVDHIEAQKTRADGCGTASAHDDTMSISSSRSGSPAQETRNAIEIASFNDATIRPSPHAITDVHLRWVFALLIRVEDHTSADEMAQLRSLARACTQLIKHGPAELAGGSWMAIACIAGHWAQHDLWTDAEEVLAA